MFALLRNSLQHFLKFNIHLSFMSLINSDVEYLHCNKEDVYKCIYETRKCYQVFILDITLLLLAES